MTQVEFTRPVKDTVPKVNEEVAVGENLDFQRRWWKFESAVWIFFALLIACDLAGVFGRGPVANAKVVNHEMTVQYERIERSGTPSMLRIDFGQDAIHDDKIRLFVSSSVVERLGAQRIIPAPASSSIGQGGITYVFPASAVPASVTFALEPSDPGVTHFTLQVEGSSPIRSTVVVMP